MAKLRNFGDPTLEVTINLFDEISPNDRRNIIEKFLFDDNPEAEIFRKEVFEALKAMGYE